MRISTPKQAETSLDPMATAQSYAPGIVDAGNAFSYSIYQHSKLPLRVFEAARIATAAINGCLLCKDFRTARDINQLGIDGGIAANGDAPDEAFYSDILDDDLSSLSQQENLAVRYARLMGNDPKGLAADEEFWKEFKATFSDEEVTDITYCIAAWMGMGRAIHVLGLDVACMTPASPEQAA